MWLKNNFHWVVFTGGIVLMLSLFLLIENDAQASATPSSNGKMALLVYSNLTGTDSNEVIKINCFQDHLIDEGFGNDDIRVYGPQGVDNADGTSNVSNVESGLSWLADDNYRNKEIVIYISDHSTGEGGYSLNFFDGTLTATDIDSYLDDMTYSEFTFILGGNHSGLAGNYIARPGLDVITSMREDQAYNPDEFNITRSLNDQLADSDSDGEITYLEAAEREIVVMATYTDQMPRIWYG